MRGRHRASEPGMQENECPSRASGASLSEIHEGDNNEGSNASAEERIVSA